MRIIPFSEDSLAESLKNSHTTPNVIKEKNHFLYLNDYLGQDGLNAKTIVIEDKYVSKDFLQDFASYYALCFTEYSKFCKRIHFFNNVFSEEDFNKEILKGDNKSDFWKNYLGFIVVKPIPVTVIGYTVLKTYEGNRNFWGLREYNVHICGCSIPIKSLAFQEQDSVLAACATTAIWSMLNKAAADFHTILKSPSEITRDADNKHIDGSRMFPNKGLNILQICQAIVNSGLAPEVKQSNFPFTDVFNNANKCIPNRYLKKIINAYAPIGIPILLVIAVPDGDEYGYHAVTVSGHSIKDLSNQTPKTNISYRSDDIEKLYVHDDQWGPFAKVEFEGEHLITTWTTFHHNKWPTILKGIIIPIYPKIRITYADISQLVIGFDALLTTFFDGNTISDLVWDVKIQFSEDYKCGVRTSSLSENEKIRILGLSMPKYIWVATCYIDSYQIIDITFDATEMSNGMIINNVLNYLPADITLSLIEFLEYSIPHFDFDLFGHRLADEYYHEFLKKIKTSDSSADK